MKIETHKLITSNWEDPLLELVRNLDVYDEIRIKLTEDGKLSVLLTRKYQQKYRLVDKR